MANNLDSWIKEVEVHLADLSPGDRARIIVELDTQIRSLPQNSYEFLSATLGSPLQVANRYKLSRNAVYSGSGHQTPLANSGKPLGSSARRFFKYATLSILAFFFLAVASVFIIPLVIFKYLTVDTFEKDFRVSWGAPSAQTRRLEGRLQTSSLQTFAFRLSNGQVKLAADRDAKEISYDCEIDSERGVAPDQVAKADGEGASLTLLAVDGAHCDITVPQQIALNVNVNSGKITLSEMSQPVEANITNGEIEFESSNQASYQVDANISVGAVIGKEKFDALQKNKKGPQYTAILSVGNGMIELE